MRCIASLEAIDPRSAGNRATGDGRVECPECGRAVWLVDPRRGSNWARLERHDELPEPSIDEDAACLDAYITKAAGW